MIFTVTFLLGLVGATLVTAGILFGCAYLLCNTRIAKYL